MQQTLFHIPHWLFHGPLLIGWLGAGLLVLGALVWRKGWGSESLNFLPVWLVGAALLYFVVPGIEVAEINPEDPNGPPIPGGLAVRGYGVMVLLGLVAGIGMTVWRAWREGLNPDRVLTAIFVSVVCGIIGARLFYVIQNLDEFVRQPPLAAMRDMINLTEGGLVVYGSLIGGGLGGWIYMSRARLPILKLADISAPGMLVGLSLGRIGCLMNGCCFGGVCDLPSIAQHFPAGAPPYMRQLYTGELLGIDSVERPESNDGDAELAAAGWRYATGVEPGSIADRSGVKAGQWFFVELPETLMPVDKYLRIEHEGVPTGLELTVREQDRAIDIPFATIPARSLGVTPAQLLASINAFLLATVLWFYFPMRRYDGQVFALLLIFYAVTRFLLEIIRQDEYGQFGTSLTIAQWVSLVMFAGGIALFTLARQPVARFGRPGGDTLARPIGL